MFFQLLVFKASLYHDHAHHYQDHDHDHQDHDHDPPGFFLLKETSPRIWGVSGLIFGVYGLAFWASGLVCRVSEGVSVARKAPKDPNVMANVAGKLLEK